MNPVRLMAVSTNSARRRLISLFSIVAILCASVVLGHVSATGNLSIAGEWVFDVEKSDDLHKSLAKRLEFLDLSSARRVNTSDGPVVLGKVRRRPTEKQITELIQALDKIVPLKPLVKTYHQGAVVNLFYADGRERRIYTDGRDSATTVQSTAMNHDQQLVIAAWEEQALIVETNTNSGIEILESYKVNQEDGSLQVIISVDSAALPKSLQVNYVYLPVLAD